MPALIALPQALQGWTSGIEVVHADRQAGKLRADHVDLDGIEGARGGIRAEGEILSVRPNATADSRPCHQQPSQVEQSRRRRGRHGGPASERFQNRQAGRPDAPGQVDPFGTGDALERGRLVVPIQGVAALANTVQGMLGGFVERSGGRSWPGRPACLLPPRVVHCLAVYNSAVRIGEPPSGQASGRSSPRPPERLLLGAPLSLTGRYALMGRLAAVGLWQAVGDVRAVGGVRIGAERFAPALAVVDDQSTREGVRRALDDLVEADVLFGPYGSDLVEEAAEAAAERRRVIWNHGGSADQVEGLPGVVSVLSP